MKEYNLPVRVYKAKNKIIEKLIQTKLKLLFNK